ncbi:cytochrome c oxidase assembly protein [Pontibacter sp. SGAir0037]|uniref:cytochrome c oxidase assembly protein n=1 Tax=Pontibacter sp. SGAir0037 TaxID=2571030 RepID=UPI0010CD622F|nr:cytochrome c oxidase assembly protein [Pontibacter sp. SGAir0037]QCR21688.1 cytochrome c oxidase assembly protein [Pontibacter sp. SGAir0037]
MHQHYTQSGSLSWLLPLLLGGLLLALYCWGLSRQYNLGKGWNIRRTVYFTIGCLLMVFALLPPVMQWAHQDFRVHMVQHLLLGMLAPLGLVLGAPVSLALRTVPASAARTLAYILGSKLFHLAGHPVTTLFLNIGGMYVLYLTPLYKATLTNPVLHYLVHLHFLAAGYLFTWSVAGPDPAPRRPGLQVRLVVLFTGIAAHAFLSKFMYAYLYPLYTPHSAAQIRSGAKIMYYGGDLAELLLAVALFATWYRRQSVPRQILS